jgi:hypothetical protein
MSNAGLADAASALDAMAAGIKPNRFELMSGALALNMIIDPKTASTDLQVAYYYLTPFQLVMIFNGADMGSSRLAQVSLYRRQRPDLSRKFKNCSRHSFVGQFCHLLKQVPGVGVANFIDGVVENLEML